VTGLVLLEGAQFRSKIQKSTNSIKENYYFWAQNKVLFYFVCRFVWLDLSKHIFRHRGVEYSTFPLWNSSLFTAPRAFKGEHSASVKKPMLKNRTVFKKNSHEPAPHRGVTLANITVNAAVGAWIQAVGCCPTTSLFFPHFCDSERQLTSTIHDHD